MALESHAQAVENVLHASLSFKLRPSASYVTDRKFVTFWPQGSSEYKVTGGVKVIKINVNGTDWLDPSSMKLHFIVKNDDASADLVPYVPGIHNWFRRLRVIIGGQVVEDIDNYNRVVHMSTMKDVYGMTNSEDFIFTTLHYDALMEINDTGVTVME